MFKIRKIGACLCIIAMISMLLLCGCKEETAEIEYDTYTKIADNLYEVTCDEYDYDYMLEDGSGNADYLETNSYGCSAIKEGNFVGRNFDFIAGDASEFIVKTTSKENRYATIGLAGGLMWMSSDFVENKLDEDAKKIIPLMILDGINEKGLFVEGNCVNATDVGGATEHTNPGKKQIFQLSIPRYLLDNAATADEAIKLLKNIDIVNGRDVMGLDYAGYEGHFLIADKDKSYVVEFDNNEDNKLIIMKNESIMTNFYNHKSDIENGIYPDNSLGIERYLKLKDNRSKVDSIDSMKELMQSIKFTNSNRLDGEYDPGENYDNKYTCFSDHPITGDNPINWANYKYRLNEVINGMKKEGKEIKKVLADPELKNPNRLWCTSHSSVYDLENKTLSFAIFERFDKYYDYSF